MRSLEELGGFGGYNCIAVHSHSHKLLPVGFRAGLRYCCNRRHSGPKAFPSNHAPWVGGG